MVATIIAAKAIIVLIKEKFKVIVIFIIIINFVVTFIM